MASKITKTPKCIQINPKVRFGKPCIKGTRITIADILNLIQSGYNLKEIPKQYPSVKLNDVKISLRYVASILGNEEVLEIS